MTTEIKATIAPTEIRGSIPVKVKPSEARYRCSNCGTVNTLQVNATVIDTIKQDVKCELGCKKNTEHRFVGMTNNSQVNHVPSEGDVASEKRFTTPVSINTPPGSVKPVVK